MPSNPFFSCFHQFADVIGGMAVCPDLYRGKVAIESEEAHHLMDNLNWSNAVEDVRRCQTFLKSKGCSKVRTLSNVGGAVMYPEKVVSLSLSSQSLNPTNH